MARPRVDLVASAGFLYARERVWAAIRDLHHWLHAHHREPGVFDRTDVEFLTKLGQETVKKVLGGLITAGYIAPASGNGQRREKNRHGQLRTVRLRLVRDIGVAAPRVTHEGKPCRAGEQQEALWLAMRSVREWSAAELAAIATTSSMKVTRERAQTYARALRKAGYVVQHGKRGRELYRLLPSRNTGPRPPVIQGDGAIFDVNQGKVVWQP